MQQISRTISHVVTTTTDGSWSHGLLGDGFIVAVIAGAVALFGTIVSRSNAKLQARLTANVKLADFRQSWINSLRADMAEFQALAVTPGLDFQSKTEFYKLMARIELSMNPADADYKALSDLLYNYIQNKPLETRFQANTEFVRICQGILKREWDVLRDEVKSVAGPQER